MGPPETNIKSGGYLPASNPRMWEVEMGSGASCLARLAVQRTLGSVREPPLLYKVSDQENQPGSALGPHTCTCELHICEHAYMHKHHTHGKSASFIHSFIQQKLALCLTIYLFILCVYIYVHAITHE